jgi:hypothetical protein
LSADNFHDSCSDDNFHYVVDSNTLYSIQFPCAGDNIWCRDTQAIPNTDVGDWCYGVCCDGTYVYTASLSDNSDDTSITAYSIDANGQITVEDTATKNAYK